MHQSKGLTYTLIRDSPNTRGTYAASSASAVLEIRIYSLTASMSPPKTGGDQILDSAAWQEQNLTKNLGLLHFPACTCRGGRGNQ